jgi:hypothetical protein
MVGFIYSGGVFAVEAYDRVDYQHQLYSEVVPLEWGQDADGKAIYYKVQPSYGQYLYLGANEVFFSPVGKLTSSGVTQQSALTLNDKKEFEYITGFKRQGDIQEWGFITNASSHVQLDCFIEGALNQVGLTFELQMDSQPSSQIALTSEMIANGFFSVNFSDLSQGAHTFKMKLVKNVNGSSLKIFNARLLFDSEVSSYVMRERWRPKSIYSEWTSSKNTNDTQAWIMELYSESELGHYAPLTTNFGYMGPIFEPGGSVKSMNMSIWSSGDQEGPLPIEQQSHLLGIGSEKATFGRWSHEGYGVKVEDWDNFDNNLSKKYVIGLRYQKEGDFTTYYGYFWNEGTSNWQLYSVGRKWTKDSMEELKNKAFIEVLGGAFQERSGHKERKVYYRGWVRNSLGIWSDLDRFIVPKGTEFTNQRRGVSQDKKYFFASTGGLANQAPEPKKRTLKKEQTMVLPEYMSAEKLELFDKLPFVPVIQQVAIETDGQFKVHFKTNTSSESTVTICFGSKDALSNEWNWEHSETFTLSAGNSDADHVILLPATENVRYFRVLVKDTSAQMWSFETYDLQGSN